MSFDYKFSFEKVERRIEELSSRMCTNVFPIEKWSYTTEQKKPAGDLIPKLDNVKWTTIQGLETTPILPGWFRTNIKPEKTHIGYPLKLQVRFGGLKHSLINREGLVYVNGELRFGVDAFHQNIDLTEYCTGESFEILIYVYWVPEKDLMKIWPKSRQVNLFETSAVIFNIHDDIQKFYWDIFTLYESARILAKDRIEYLQILKALEEVFSQIDFREEDLETFKNSCVNARKNISDKLFDILPANQIPSTTVVGQTHIDVAWLWPINITHNKIARTFSNMLRFMEKYPDFIFFQNQSVVYKYCKEYFPLLFEKVTLMIKAGRWEANGGMWVEPDCNLPNGESLVRQVLYGERFFKKEFGQRSNVLCLMDVFGFPGSLPQIIKDAGINNVLTTKMSFNQYNRMPYDTFLWEGIDGSEVMTYFLTTPVPGASLSNNLFTCNAVLEPESVKKAWENYQQKDINQNNLVTYGFGDGGGGPTSEMLEMYERMKKLNLESHVKTGTLREYFDQLNNSQFRQKLPVWRGEMFPEFHRGTFTTKGNLKRANRKAEILLHNIELFSVMSKLVANVSYPQDKINLLWENLLTNQMHDILPGSIIKEAEIDSLNDFAELFRIGEKLLQKSLISISNAVKTDANSLVVFNALSWDRTEIIEVNINSMESDDKKNLQITDQTGRQMRHQVLRKVNGKTSLLFEAENVPACGYKVFSVNYIPITDIEPIQTSLKGRKEILENKYLRVQLDSNANVSSLYDKINNREILPAGVQGGILQVYEDKPLNHDAWDIDIFYESSKQEYITDSSKVELVENGPLRSVIKVVRKFKKSTIEQYIILYENKDSLDYRTEVDWQEHYTLMKVKFPTDLNVDRATYEIQFGAVERPTHRNTLWDQAKFEVYGHKWADISEGDYGVSLLNDCKYGYDIHKNDIRLTLLKSPRYPDPSSDQGFHEFQYSVVPHSGNWTNGIVRKGYEFNSPMLVIECNANGNGTLEKDFSMFRLSDSSVIIDTVKLAEDGENIIVRLFESHNSRSEVKLSSFRKMITVEEVNILEESKNTMSSKRKEVSFEMLPYKIKTLSLDISEM